MRFNRILTLIFVIVNISWSVSVQHADRTLNSYVKAMKKRFELDQGYISRHIYFL